MDTYGVLILFLNQKIGDLKFMWLDFVSLISHQTTNPLKNLYAGPKPIYIGFGSLPVQEPEKMTQTIVKALEISGQRGIINKGWGGLGVYPSFVLERCKYIMNEFKNYKQRGIVQS
ncbi:unnamed protein product [Lactuca saligna]|uniref:Uncharacterized protein n=1 Tax=Lactuca saligna TaxID=75948 RepID=A0AA35YM99_LACSI|nr:unnamed protein product [Lactuca saligna]